MRPRQRSALLACLTLLLAVSLTACSSGSRSGPSLARADAQPLAALATRISHEGACAQRRHITLLQQRAVKLVNTHQVPAAIQDPLMSGVNALAADSPPCVPAVPVQRTTTVTPPPAPYHPRPHPHPHPKPPKHEHGHGHDKHKGKD